MSYNNMRLAPRLPRHLNVEQNLVRDFMMLRGESPYTAYLVMVAINGRWCIDIPLRTVEEKLELLSGHNDDPLESYEADDGTLYYRIRRK